MGTRLELQEKLENTMAEVDERYRKHVYFQPPANIKMAYPCIVYTLEMIDIDYADNGPYKHRNRYAVTVIDKNPDSDIPGKIAMYQLVSFSRKFENDNLNHYVFQLYF